MQEAPVVTGHTIRLLNHEISNSFLHLRSVCVLLHSRLSVQRMERDLLPVGQNKGRDTLGGSLPTAQKVASLPSTRGNIQHYKSAMGLNSVDNQRGHQQHQSNRLVIHPAATINNLDILKRVTAMSEVKMVLRFINGFGYSFTGLLGLNWVIPLMKIEGLEFGGWKSSMVLVLVCLFWLQKTVFGGLKNWQEYKSRQLSLKKKAHDVEKELED